MAEHYRGELGPFCWPIPAAGIAVFDASYRFAEHTSQMEWFCQDSESYNGSDRLGADHQTVTMTFSWCKFGFRKCFGASWSHHWTGNCTKSTFCHTYNPIEKWFVVVVQNKRRQHFKIMIFFNLWSVHEAPTYQAFLPLQIVSNAKWPQNGQCSVLQQLLVRL